LLRSIIISPDQQMAQRLESALSATGEIAVGRILNRYPNAIDLVRTLRAHAPDVIFLSFETVDKAHEVVKFLEAEARGLQIVAIHRQCDAKLLRETMRVGVREFLSDPFERTAVVETVGQLKILIARQPAIHEATSEIFAFLPSKAGVGTSTLALNISAAMARRPDLHVLLCDFDLNSGMVRFMLKLQNEYSVIDAVEHSMHVDEHVWPQLVTSLDDLDVLHAGRINPNLRVETAQIRALVDFTRRNYQALCFDLSGNLERYSIEIMQEAKRVLLVCTPEIASLHQAREKLHFLKALDLDTRISVVLNRCQKKPLFTDKQVEEILGLPVIKMFPNDYHGVNRAMTAGSFVEPKSDLGRSIEQFAQELLERRAAPAPSEKHKFLEYFAVPPRQFVSGQK
jgi:pilus assembly protein CpaE